MLKRRIWVTIFILSIVFTIWGVVDVVIRIKSTRNGRVYVHTSVTDSAGYIQLFNPLSQKDLKIKISHYVAYRQPMTEFIYNDDISIVVNELKMRSSSSLQNCISINLEGEVENKLNFYVSFILGNINFGSKTDTIPVSEHTFLNLEGDSINKILNSDNIIGYSLIFKKLSIAYGKDKAQDIFARKAVALSRDPKIQVIFFKRNDKVYLVFIFNNNNERFMDSDLPRELFSN